MRNKNKRGGFTIVELVIVIAVIAILASVLVPTFSNIIEDANNSKALQEARNGFTAYLINEAHKGGTDIVIKGGKYFYIVVNGELKTKRYNTAEAAQAAINANAEWELVNDKLGIYAIKSAENVPNNPDAPDIPDELLVILKDGFKLTVVDSISEMIFVNTHMFNGETTQFEAIDDCKKATSVGFILAVSGGETIEMTETGEDAGVTFAIAEFVGELGEGNALGALVPGGQNMSSWIGDTITLQDDTRYVIINFQIGSKGKLPLEDDVLEYLPRSLIVKKN